MTKIVLIVWMLVGGSGVSEPVTIEGNWVSLSECQVDAESLTLDNPKEARTYGYAVITKCVEIPTK